jgi:predicted RNA-binding protein YlqC (UPF0109 family)
MHDLAKTQKLILRIVRAITEHTETATVTQEHIPKKTQWYIRVHPEDQGKVRGRKAAHIIALQYIVQEIGYNHDEVQRVTLLDSPSFERIEGIRSPLRMAEHYNPMDAHELLHDILTAILASPFRIDVRTLTETAPLAYDFHITTTTEEDQAALLESYDEDPTRNTLIAALGTLWRAYANREGVEFKISTESR